MNKFWIAAVVVGLYFLWRHEQQAAATTVTPLNPGNGIPPLPGTATASGTTQTIGSQSSGLAGSITGGLNTFENLSENLGVKTASLVGIPAAVSRPIAKYGNPVALANDVVTGTKYTIKGVSTAGKAVGSAAKTVAGGIASGAKAAGSAVESGAKTVLGWL